MEPAKILIADDHMVLTDGLRYILDRPEFTVVGVVADGQALVSAAAKLHPDVVIADISMPLLNGIDATQQIRKHNLWAKIVILTMHDEIAYALAALGAGASGYVLKSAAADELITAIQSVLKGNSYISKAIAQAVADARISRTITTTALTLRQREVLQLIAEGKQVKEISAILKMSPKTAEFHKYAIMNRLNLHTVADLARYAQKHGIVD